MADDVTKQILALSEELLTSIAKGDWKKYTELVDPSITCFEPEARGQVAVGMAFHKYYFDLPGSPQKPTKNVTMAQPHVRLLGDSAARPSEEHRTGARKEPAPVYHYWIT